MPRVPLPVFAAVVAGLFAVASPGTVRDTGSEYAEFLSMHDLLHPSDLEKIEPHRIFIRRTFWDNDQRVLRVDADTSEGKGALVIVEGAPGADWLTAFSIAGADGATFELPVPADEAVPCEVIVRSGAAVRVSAVENSPALCEQPGSGDLLLASL